MIRLTVGTVSAQKFAVVASPSDTVESVKAQLYRESRIPPEEQRLLFSAEDLPDDRTLGDCGVGDEAHLHLVLKLERPPNADLTAAMSKHGLSEDEQIQLHKEGVADVETFAALRDEDFVLSGVDIGARRQEKLQLDRAAAQIRHADALKRQAQALLEEAGLRPAGRRALDSLREVGEVQRLTPERMTELGLGIVDRQTLSDFIRTERVRSAQPVGAEEVLTEPQRSARRPQEKQRQLAALQQRRERLWQLRAAKSPVLRTRSVVDSGPARSLEELFLRHGLTDEDAAILEAEGVDSMEDFDRLDDGQFRLSGIDIAARRQEKLQRDRAAASVALAEALVEQVQSVLDEAGLRPRGREDLRAARSSHQLRNLGALRRLDVAAMAELGLKIADRHMLQAFCQSSRVQEMRDVPLEEVLTEPERARRATETERQQEVERQRREEAEREREAAAAAEQRRQEEVERQRQAAVAEAAARQAETDRKIAKVWAGLTVMVAGHALQWAGWLTLYSHLAGALGLVGMLVVLGSAYWFGWCLDHVDDEWTEGHKYTEDERREIDEQRDRDHAAAVAEYSDDLARWQRSRSDERGARPTEPTRRDRLQEGDRSASAGDRVGFAVLLFLVTGGSIAASVLSWQRCPAVWSWDHAVEARIEGNTTSRGMLQLNIDGGGWGAEMPYAMPKNIPPSLTPTT
jgi:hypothetical protein